MGSKVFRKYNEPYISRIRVEVPTDTEILGFLTGGCFLVCDMKYASHQVIFTMLTLGDKIIWSRDAGRRHTCTALDTPPASVSPSHVYKLEYQ